MRPGREGPGGVEARLAVDPVAGVASMRPGRERPGGVDAGYACSAGTHASMRPGRDGPGVDINPIGAGIYAP